MKFNILISFGIVLELLICRSIHAAGFSIVNSVNPYALSVASDGDGDFVVVWDDTPGGDSQIYARAFDARGNARTESFQVNTFNEGDQDSPVVSMRTDGDFVAVWQSAGQDGSGAGVYGRRYSANGMALGDEFLVNGTTTGDQANSRIAMNVTGDFAIVWEGNGIWVRRYGADGFALTGELRVDSPAASPGRHPDVALDASGNFVVVWQRSEGNLTQSVRARRFTKVGEAIGDETTVGAGTLALFPRVDVNLIGDFVVVWKDMNLTKARLFNPDGVAKGDELTVHTGDLFAQPDVIMPANVSMDVAGGFSIVWNAYSAANWSHLSYCQRYDNTGMALGSPAVLSPGGPFPDVALDPQGDTIAVSKAQGGIYAESFPAAMDHAGPLVTDVLINGLSILDGAQIPEAVTNLKLTFSEELAASPGGVNSVVNTANWLLSSEGVEVPGTISRITASFNTNTLKYEAVVVLDGNGEMPGTSALSEGNYTITVRDLVTDFVGNSLDGDYDGTPGGNFSRSFSVLNGSTTTDLLFRQVAAGGYHTVGVKTDGTLWSWGNNSWGQLGDGTTSNKSTPVQVGTASDWQLVVAGYGHTIATKTDGTLWAWGGNSYYQLGDGTAENKSNPVQVGTGSDWQSVVAGEFHTMAIKTDGTLWAWGNNSSGQLGDGTTTSKSSPLQIGTATNWQSVAARYRHTVAVKTDGTLWVWGDNYRGQLGDGTEVDKYSPVQIGTASDWHSVAAGSSHTAAVKTDGTLWAWGNNSWGELGDGTTTNKSSPVQIGTGSSWQSVAAGGCLTLAVKTDGTLWAWGRNDYGQLGDGTTTSKSSPLQIGTATNWQSVAAGCWHTVAVKTDGTLWSWGNNLYGQLGDGTPVDKYSPVQIGTATNWQSVAAGEGHTVAVKTDGTLWAWGYNSDGQLGTDLHQTPGKIGAPVVLAQPVSLSAGTLTTATFHIIASGSQPLGYQWRKDGLDLPEGGKFTGVLTPTITIADVQNNDAGNYTVVVANNYGSVTSSVAVLKIKAVATVTLGNLQQTYDGTARSVSVSTAPPGLAVNVTYNGSPSAPTNAGSYTVIATVSDPNYEGSATNTLVVEKTAATVSLGNLFQIYDGTAHRVSVSTTPSGLAVDVTYNGSPAAPADTGSYTVIGTINEVNYRGSATNTLVISLPQGPPSHLTAILGHSSSPAGGLFGYAIWDTLPGGFFNLFLAPGEPGGNPDGLTAPLINGPTDADVAINIALQPGTNTYTIFGSPPWQAGTHMALNLYFDTNRAMLISALAPVKTNAYMPPVVANVSSQTVTLDGSSVPAAGALSFTNVFWSITLAEYFWSNTNVFSVDRVTRPPNSQGGNAVPDGLNDFVGMISLVVAPINHLEVPPSLSISLDPTNGVLAWPGEAANYRLQTCESLSPSVNWLQVTNLPTLSSNRCEIRLPRSDTSQFFRLIKP